MPNPRSVSLPVDAGQRRPVLRELRRRPAGPPVRRRRPRSAAAFGFAPRSRSACSRSRARRSSAPCRPSRAATGRARHSSRSTRRPARSTRWSAGRITTRASSTSRPRDSASPARPSSPSCSRRRSSSTSRRRASSTRSPSRSTPADALAVVHNYEGDYLGPIDLAKAIAVSDNSVFSQLTALVGPPKVAAAAARSLGITSPLQGYFSIGLGSEWTTPLDMARAYASFADGGFRIDDSVFGNEPRTVDCLEDAHGKCIAKTAPVLKPALGTRAPTARCAPQIMDQLLQARRHERHRHRRPDPRPRGRRQDRHDRELRRRLVRRLHPAARHRRLGRVPQLGAADDRPVPRPAGRRRLVPGADLEGVHDAGARLPEAAARGLHTSAARSMPRPESRSSTATTSSSATTASARTTFQLDFYSAQGPRVANCKVNEVQVPDVVGSTLDRGAATAPAAAARDRGRLRAGQEGPEGRRRRRPVPEGRNAVVVAEGDGRAGEVTARRRAAGHRAHDHTRDSEAREAQRRPCGSSGRRRGRSSRSDPPPARRQRPGS